MSEIVEPLVHAIIGASPVVRHDIEAGVARGDAWIPGNLRAQLEVQPGDFVRVEVDAGAWVVCEVAGDVDPDDEVVKLSRLIRAALETSPGEQCRISPMGPLPALQRCTLVPPLEVPIDEPTVRRTARVLGDRPVPASPGMYISLPAGRHDGRVTYKVSDTAATPDTRGEAGLIGSGTYLDILPPDPLEFEALEGASGVEDVGGLRDQLDRLMDLIAVPIQQPGLYRYLGIRPAKGILLHGPPGSGKTLLCRSLAHELSASFIHLSAPEVVGGHHGDTEKRIRAVFRKAVDSAPAIIFIDEIDALARSRDDLSSQADQRAVAQLLSLMDGLHQTEGVMVVGTTNRLSVIDEAFRRPGRFDAEILIGPPDREARAEILRIHTRDMPLSQDAADALPQIAFASPGFTGADLAGLCREAGIESIRRLQPRQPAGGNGHTSAASYRAPAASSAWGEGHRVEFEDFQRALEASRPSVGRAVRSAGPEEVPFDEVTGGEQAYRLVKDAASTRLSGTSEAGLAAPRGLLVHGQGTGKLALARHLASDLGANLMEVHATELYSQWQGEAEARIRQMFDTAVRLAPTVLVIRQMEAVAAGGQSTDSHDRIKAQLAASIDSLPHDAAVFIVGITDSANRLDRSIRTGGRLELAMEFSLPPDTVRERIIAQAVLRHDAALGKDAELLETLVRATEGMHPTAIRVFLGILLRTDDAHDRARLLANADMVVALMSPQTTTNDLDTEGRQDGR